MIKMDLWQEIQSNLSSEKRRELLRLLTDSRNRNHCDLDLAIVGVSGRYPQARTLDEYWDNLSNGKNCITEVPAERWNWSSFQRTDPKQSLPKWGGFIEEIDRFDPLFFGIAPKEAEVMDPQERLFLEITWALFENAGITRKALQKIDNRVGVFVGAMNCDYMREGGNPVAYWSIANRVSYFFNLQGPSLAVDTACSSSLAAIHLACASLRRGECLAAIAGGVNLIIRPEHFETLLKARMLTQEDQTRSFGEHAEGFVAAEGVGAILIKPLALALSDHDSIYAIIRGSAMNAGGKTSGYGVPNPNAQRDLIKEALKAARIHPRTLSYLEAQANGSDLGDPIEVSGLIAAFKQYTQDKHFCALGSVKSNIGHSESAAGIAAITKVLLQMKHKQLVPTLHCETVNSKINLEDSPFYLQRHLSEWKKPIVIEDGVKKVYPRRAGVSSFGAGGANVHIILEEYEAEVNDTLDTLEENKVQLIVLSAKNQERLKEQVRNIADYLEKNRNLNLPDIAYTLQIGREAMEERFAITVDSCETLLEKLQAYLDDKLAVTEYYSGNVRKHKTDRFVTKERIQELIATSQLVDLARLWVEGNEIDWELLASGSVRQRISLPTYPFLRERFWVPEAAKFNVSEDKNYLEQPFSNHSVQTDLELDLNRSFETQFESDLKEGISAILGVKIKDIDLELEMSDFGFNSITLTQFSELINEKYQLNIMPSIFFEHATLASFVDHLKNNYHKELLRFYQAHLAQIAIHDQPDTAPTLGSLATVPVGKENSPAPDLHHKGESFKEQEVAIIGISAVMPLSEDLEVFWNQIEAGKDLISVIPADRWDWRDYYGDPATEPNKTNVIWGGFMKDIDKFDAQFFGISPREARLLDPQHRIFLETVWKAVEDSGYKMSDLAGTATGVFAAVATNDYENFLNEQGVEVEAQTATGSAHSLLANRVSYLFNLHGPSEPIDTACSSSLVAIHRAIAAIHNGECELAIVGGVNAIIHPKLHIAFSKSGMLAEDGRCKTFDKRANGYVRSEGCGVIILKPLAKAQNDGDHIYAVIRGSAINHGGHANSLTAPNPNAQAQLIINVWEKAGLDPSTVGYIETHGSGTSLGDPVEINGLKKAFEHLYKKWNKTVSQAHCGLGTVKTYAGHLETAAGIAGVINTLLFMKHRKLLPNLHFEELNPYIQLEGSPFYIVDKVKNWDKLRDEQGRELPRRAGVSSFGFGGVNAHIILEEYELPTYAEKFAGPYLIVLSAKNETVLKNYAAKLRSYLERAVIEDPTQVTLARVAFTLQVGRVALETRCALVVADWPELFEKLNRFSAGDRQIEGLYFGTVERIKPAVNSSHLLALIKSGSLEAIAQQFVAGASMDWSLLYPVTKPCRISLPTYPFERERHWVDVKPNKIGINKNESQVTNDLVKQLQAILAEVLFIEVDQVDNDKAFTELGLDSVLSLEFTQKINHQLGVKLKTARLYDYSTINKLANYLDSLKMPTDKVQIRPQEDFPKSPPFDENGEKVVLSSLADPTSDERLNFSQQGREKRELPKIKLKDYKVAAEEVLDNPDKMQTGDLIIKQVQKILAEVLYIEIDKIDKNKPFSELGLDSVLSLEFTQKINRVFGVKLKTARLYDFATVKELAEYLSTLPIAINETRNESFGNIASGQDPQNQPADRAERSFIAPERYQNQTVSANEIAVIGISCRFPGANNHYQFWENLKNGVDCVSEVPSERWDINQYYSPNIHAPGKTYCKWGGFLHDIDQFDPLFFNISPAEAELLDPQQRLFLMESWRALEDAGYAAKTLDNLKCGVYVGVMTGGEYQPSNLFNTPSILASRIAYFLNLKGPAVAIDTACSSSAVAIHLACQSLINGETEMMLAGGVTLYLTVNPYISMCKGGMLSRDGRCKAFDNRADGFVPAEGVGVVVLKRLDRAIQDGDSIYGVIKASAMNQDGRTNGITAPSAQSQTELETMVYERAGISPESISYVECHGTGTKLGDPIEIDALTATFHRYTDKKQICPIGSVKTNIGHTSAASGVAGLIKIILALKHQIIPPSLYFQKENEQINFSETPFYVNTKAQSWITSALPRRAALNSFGFSGTNVHMIIEEAPKVSRSKAANKEECSCPYYLIPLSAKEEAVVLLKLKELADWLANAGSKSGIGDIAYTLGTGRNHFSYRIALVVTNIPELESMLNRLIAEPSEISLLIKKAIVPVEVSVAPDQIEAVMEELQPTNKLPDSLFKEKLNWLAEQYLGGFNLDWERLYKAWGFHKISLPTYPFLLKRYWRDSLSADNLTPGHPVSYHQEISMAAIPMVEIPVETPHEKRFQISFSGREFYLKDNSVYGQKLLSPAVFPEIICTAYEIASGKRMKTLTDLVMLRLIDLNELGNLYVSVLLKSDPAELIISTVKNGITIINAKAKASFETSAIAAGEQAQQINIEKIKERCPNFLNRQQFYEICDRTGHLSGTTLKPIQWIFYSDKEALALIEMDNTLKQSKNHFKLHPSLLQGTLTAFTGLVIDSIDQIQNLRILSFGIKKLEMINPLPDKFYTYVKWSNNQVPDSQLLHFDFQVFDLQGNLVFEIKDYYLKKIESLSQTVNFSNQNLQEHPNFSGDIIFNQLLKDVTAITAEILKINDIALDTQINLLEYGFTSITIMEFIQAVNERFKIEVTLDSFFDLTNPSLHSLTRHLYGQYQPEIDNYYSCLEQIASSQLDESIPDNPNSDLNSSAECLPSPTLGETQAHSQQIIVLSARNKESLKDYAQLLLAFLKDYQETTEVNSQNFATISRNFQTEIMRIAKEVLQVTPAGYLPETVVKFTSIINERFGLTATPELFLQSSSVALFAKYLARNFKSAILAYYPTAPVKPDLNLTDLAYTLQTGSAELEERLAIIVPTLESLLAKLTAYCQDQPQIEGVFQGNIKNSNMVAASLQTAAEGVDVTSLIQKGNYSQLAQFWVNGGEINWKLLYAHLKTPAYINLLDLLKKDIH